jgi:osmotically-inducible protein OsmY
MNKFAEVQQSWEPDYDSEAAKLETDKTLEKKVMSALKANVFINCEKIRVRVSDRLVFLEGTVHQQKERISAQTCIKDLFGIRAVINYLTYHNEYAH